MLVVAGTTLAALRKVKSEAKVSMRTEIARVELVVPQIALAGVRAAEPDIRAAGRVRELTVTVGGDEVVARGAELVE